MVGAFVVEDNRRTRSINLHISSSQSCISSCLSTLAVNHASLSLYCTCYVYILTQLRYYACITIWRMSTLLSSDYTHPKTMTKSGEEGMNKVVLLMLYQITINQMLYPYIPFLDCISQLWYPKVI